jgi:aspartate racemase
LKKIGLLWTKFTMEEDFYKWILEKKYNFDVIIPNNKDRQCIHDIIYNELCLGKINKYSKDKYIEIINKLVKEWAEWIILGCTEIPLLIKQEDINILLFDTTSIHAESASDLALK